MCVKAFLAICFIAAACMVIAATAKVLSKIFDKNNRRKK